MSNIKELCKDASFFKLYNWNNIPSKILNNAISGLSIKNDEVVLFYDTSSFGNGKTGLAICEGGIYWKNMLSQPRYMSWNSFRKVDILIGKNNIYLGENNGVFVYEENKEDLLSILRDLKIDAKVDNIVGKTEGVFKFIRGAIDFINELDTTNNNNNIENSCNEQSMLNQSSNEVYNEQPVLNQYSNEVYNEEVIDVDYKVESNENNYEKLIQEINNAKGALSYISNDLVGGLVNVTIENDGDLKMHIFEVVRTAATLSGDENLLSLFDENGKRNILELKEILDPQLKLVENVLSSDRMSEILEERASLIKVINLYNHRVKVAMEEYTNQDEEDIEEIYDSIQLALKDFRKTLKKMIKGCNYIIESIYINA